jgi:hypothetical protein
MRVAVDGGKYIGIPRADGAFVVYGVPTGTHFLEVFATGLMFPQLRVVRECPLQQKKLTWPVGLATAATPVACIYC